MAAPPFDWARADPQILSEAFEQTGASSKPPSVDWSEYAGLIAERVAEWLGDVARPLGRVFGPNVQAWLGWTVTGLAFVLVVVIAVRMIRALNQRPGIVALETVVARRRVPLFTGEQHRRNALACLEREEAHLALTSICWWFAATALKEQPDPAMTTRDVLRRSGRDDLRTRAQKLDRLRFSATAPTTTDVRELLRDFEASF